MSTHRTWTDLPGYVLRTLHSAWTDWLLEAPPEVADAMADRCCGMGFRRFALALSAERLTVTQRVTDDDELLIGIAVPTTDGNPWQLFELPPSHTGMTVEFLIALSLHHIDDQLTQMLEGGST
jgi:hypothetical protein